MPFNLTSLLLLALLSHSFQAVTCPDGFWHKTGPDTCEPCTAGNACASGATSETACTTPGQYTPGYALACANCPAGYYCPDASTIIKCPDGSYCLEGSINHSPCLANNRCSREAQTPCLAGTYSDAGATTCLPCTAGYECPTDGGGRSACGAGAVGQWSPPGSLACLACDAGYQCADPAKPPVRCPEGTRVSADKKSCEDCSLSKQACADPTNPQNCNGGQVPNASFTKCIKCPAGFACDGQDATPCAANKFSDPGAATCTNCQAGYFCSASVHYPCPRGTYQNSGACDPIPAGKYSPDATTAPQDCAAGTYLNDDQTGCTPCPQNHICAGAAAAPVACADGEYKSGNTCQTCPANQECIHPEATPQTCNEGYYLVTPGRYCAVCPRGFFCTGGVKTACPDHTYAYEGQSQCQIAQLYAGFVGTAYRIPIAYGFKRDTSTTPYSLAQCPENHYCPSPMHDEVACPTGWWSPLGLWTCIPYHPNETNGPHIFSNDNTFTSLKNYEMGKDYHFPCPMGTYNLAGDNQCKKIPKNQEFNPTTGNLSNCPTGFYSPEGEGSCRSTPAGFYLTGGTVTPCPANSYSDPGATSCSTCPAGTYSTGAYYTCIPCPAGYSCANSGELTICPLGQYSRNNQNTCSSCSEGFVCYPGSTEPRPVLYSCPRGYYCHRQSGAITVSACPAGTYGIMERGTSEAQACFPCPAGYNCPEAAQHYKWYKCAPNHFCPRQSTSEQPCPAGTYFPDIGARAEAECKPLPGGYYLDNTNLTLCPAGFYCPYGWNAPKSCPDGMYTLSSGSKSFNDCMKCPTGYYCTGGLITGPADLQHYIPLLGAMGKFQYPSPPGSGFASTGGALYYVIDEQQFKVAELGKAMALCKNGIFDGRAGMNMKECIRCKLGFDCSDGQTSTTTCPIGKYCPHNDQGYMLDCPLGTYGAAAGLKFVTECTQCPAGKFCPGGTVQQNCPIHYYCPAQTPYPVRCPAGYSGEATNLGSVSACTICPQHHYCRDGVKYECPLGTSQKKPGSTECVLCPGGYTCGAVGAKTQSLCPKGQFSIPGDPTGCQDCPKGYACKKKGISYVDLPLYRCQNGYDCNTAGTGDAVLLQTFGAYSLAGIVYNCPEGYYHLKIGATSKADCKRIPAGFYSSIAAFTTSGQLLQCPTGKYCPEGTAVPRDCPRRTFNPTVMAKSTLDCHECLAGFFCPNEGMDAYIDCPAGSYCPDGADQPQFCPQGTYSSSTKLKSSAECTLCDNGKYCHMRGMTAVGGDCYAGFYCKGGSPRPDPIGQIYGDKCPAGSFCLVGASQPSTCPAGKFNAYEGGKSANDCAPCTPGSYCIGASTATPTGPCKGGYYCPAGSSAETQNETDQGYYAPAGSPIQIPCPPGTYASSKGQAACTACEKGKYCPNSQMTGTLECPVGFYCPSRDTQVADGLTYNKIPCPPGTYRATQGAESLSQCISCEGGYGCPFYGMTSSTLYACKAGFYCTTGADSQNPTYDSSGNFGPCPKGHFCDVQTTTPAPCPTGTYMPYTGARAQAECIQCHPGMYCTGTGQLAPTGICEQGYYCVAGSTSARSATCSVGNYCPRGSGAELQCPTGYYQDTDGAYNCKRCPSGSFCFGGNKVVCPQGSYCP